MDLITALALVAFIVSAVFAFIGRSWTLGFMAVGLFFLTLVVSGGVDKLFN